MFKFFYNCAIPIFLIKYLKAIAGGQVQIDVIDELIKAHLNSHDMIIAQDAFSVHLEPILPSTFHSPCFRLLFQSFNNFSLFKKSTRKFSSQETLVISILSEGSKYLKNFADILFSKFDAPTKRDSDYYIILTETTNFETVISSEILTLMKYKVVIPIDKDMTIDKCYTRCFYCASGGKPEVVKIQIKNAGALGNLSDIFPDFTLNGNGYAMRTSSPVMYKFTTEVVEVSPGKWELTRGISKAIMDFVPSHYNFTYVAFSSPNGDTGKLLENGSWDGCIGQLISGEADLSLTTSPNRARYRAIGFSTAAFYAYVSFTVGQPKISYSWNVAFQPFTWGLWLVVIVSTVVVTLVFKMFKVYEATLTTTSKVNSFYKNLGYQMTFVLIGQNVGRPGATFSRFLLIIWLFGGLIINSLYNSKIVAMLAIPVYNSVPKTFEELSASGYQWGMDIAGGSLYAYFQSSTSPTFQKMFRGLEKPKETVNCFQVATQTKFACITWAGVADYISWRNFTVVGGRTPFVRSQEVVNFIIAGLAMKRNAVFKPNFDKTISILYDTGHWDKATKLDLEKLQDEYFTWQRDILNKPVKRYSDDKDVSPIKFLNIFGVLCIFLFGNIMASLWFVIMEVAFYYHNVPAEGQDKQRNYKY